MDEQTGGKGSQNILVDHLFQYRISPLPKTAEKCGFCTGVTDRWIDRWTDVFLADASKKRRHKQKTNGSNKTTNRLRSDF